MPERQITSSLHLRMLLLLGLVGVNLMIWAVSAFSLYQSRQQHELMARTATLNIANALDQSVSSSVERIDLALHTVVDELEHQLALQGIDEQAASTFIERQQRRVPELEAFRVADAEGYVFLGKGVVKQDRVSWADRDYFIYHRDHAEGKLHFRKPRVGRVAKQYIVNFSRRFNYPDGRFAGVVSAPVAVEHLFHLINQYDVGTNGTVILRDAELGLITRVPPIFDKPAGEVGNDSVSKEFRQLTESGATSSTYHITNSPDGFERILSYKRLEKVPIYVIVGTAIDDYLGTWKNEVRKTAVLVIGFLLLSVVLGIFLLRLLSQSVKDQTKLRKSEGHLKAIIANEPECIKILSAEGNLLQMNAAGLAMIEADSLEQVAGRPVLGVIAPEYREAFAELHRRVIAGETVQQEFEVLGLKGGRRLMETHAVPMQEGDAIVHLAVTRDITERKANENALRQAKIDAEAANLAKSRFLATMSHEIRTPMNGILGMAQLLMMKDISDKERNEYVRTILNSGNILLTLLNDILDLSKVEAGKIELTPSTFNVQQLAQEMGLLFAELAVSKSLRLDVQWHGLPQQCYRADATRLRQMVSNLLSNAIKFTVGGQIKLDIRETCRNGQIATLEFSVTDTGIGIPAQNLDSLFQPFAQVDSSNTRQFGGTGLGLSIIKNFATLMNGDVGVSSEPGKGSRFWFTVQVDAVDDDANPQLEDRPPAIHDMPTANVQPKEVMVVEDNPTNRVVIEALVRKFGYSVSLYEDGQQAISALDQGYAPALVLMDIQMPIMDGLTATRLIRAREARSTQARLPIIALTAGAFEEDRQRCIDAGMDDFLTKPINIDLLQSTFEKWLPNNQG